MADDYYSGGSSAPSEAQDSEEPTSSQDNEGMDDSDAAQEDSEQTALVPRNFLGSDVKVGDVCKVRVTHTYDDELEVKWVPPGEADKGPKSSMDESQGALDRLAKMPSES